MNGWVYCWHDHFMVPDCCQHYVPHIPDNPYQTHLFDGPTTCTHIFSIQRYLIMVHIELHQ